MREVPDRESLRNALAVPSRRWLLRRLAVLLVVALLLPVGVSAVTYEGFDYRQGTLEQTADGETVVGIQGFHFEGEGSTKKPARLLGITDDATFDWEFDGSRVNAVWYYDVDPLPNGDVLVVSTNPPDDGVGTVVVRYDPADDEVVWTETFPYTDTHDVDYLGDGELLIANMRNYNETTERNDDRILVYDRNEDEVVWEWLVREHGYDRSGGGNYEEDWTHVNDVDKVGEGLYMASLRNFDQMIVVNRSTKEIEAQLGSDGDHDVLHEQHNPDLLRSEDGTPHVLVADSENDRVVEYARKCPDADGNGLTEADPEDCEWEPVWSVGGQFNWPRDADRLPNGNTLITDSLNHRVVEVTPQGRIVWEYFAKWGPYDAERVGIHPDDRTTTGGSNGPTMSDMDVSGHYAVHNGSGATAGTGGALTFSGWVEGTFSGTPLSGPAETFAARWAHVTPWIAPVWMSSWDAAATAGALLVLLVWGGGEAVHQRRRIRAGLGRAWRRIAG
ncbi:MAG: arylsulfotransferase family protein [Halobacteriales archaeon]